MQKKYIHTIAIGMLMMCALVFSSCVKAVTDNIQPEADISATQLIRLHYIGGVSPDEITVKAGTTVIWMNDSRAPVQLQFQGQQVTMACKSPVNFIIDEHGSFISNAIPQGSVASLCFVEKGDFEYVLRKGSTGATYERREAVEFKGRITVE
jgi:plastocyanin